MASPLSFILPRSPQGAGYANSFRVSGHVFKTENDIAEEYIEEDIDKNSPYSLIEYQVQGHDTLYGIALSHNLSPETVMYDNGLSTDQVYTGQIIKIRKRYPNGSPRKGSPELNAPGLYGQQYASKGDFLAEQGKQDEVDQSEQAILNELNVVYCTGVGDVEGTIKVDDTVISFVPKSVIEKNPTVPRKQLSMPELGKELDKFETEDKLAKFITCIDVRDIDECNVMAVPNPDCDELYELTNEFPKDYLLQIILKHHGGKSMGKYFDSLMTKLRQNNVSYACVYFKVHSKQDSQREFTNKIKHKLVLELQNAILAAKSAIQDNTEAGSMTKIPYIEFLYEKFDSRDGDLLRKAVKKTVMNDRKTFEEHEAQAKANKQPGNRGFFGKKFFAAIKKMTGTLMLMDDSQTLTKDQFGELIRCIPQLYQTLEWQLVYSNKAHGTSFSTMMRKTASASPLILVIQDEHGFAFGAFVSHKLKLSTQYYGSGETFLFTFRDLDDISTFHWSKKNSMFINVSEGGIMFGAGPQYGLWINSELTKGRSYQCDTFDNPVLSLGNEFQIIKMEIWTISDAVHISRLVKHNSLL